MKKHLLSCILLVLFGCQSQVIDEQITVCSFNIAFVGHYKKKDNEALARLVEQYDMVVVQELVAFQLKFSYISPFPKSLMAFPIHACLTARH